MLDNLVSKLISRAETRLGVTLDYTRKIAATDLGLLRRYNRIFRVIDPNTHVPAVAYHAARLRGALAADCGTCVEAEINLAKAAGVSPPSVTRIVLGDYTDLPEDVAAVAMLADAVTRDRCDAPDARETVRHAYGEAGLIEVSLAMNGAVMLPGIKRAMGYATACHIDMLKKVAGE